MPFNPKQLEYFQNATHRWNIKTGATRSGKTFADFSFVIPRRIMACTGSGLIVLMGNTQGSFNRNVLEPMRKIWGGHIIGTIHTNDNSAILFGKRCFVLGADKKNRVAAIQGSGMEYCYGDELTTWSEDVFSMLKSRLDKPNSVFDGTCNPDNPDHWVKKFIDSGADIYHQHYTIDDNPKLDPIFVANLKAEYTGLHYHRYILGEWVRAEGLVYPNAAAAIVPTEPRTYTEYQISCDYGIHNPTAFGLFGKCGGVWYMIKEYYHSGRDTKEPKTDDEYYIELDRFAGDLPIRRVIVDPSASSFITLIRRRGRFTVKEGANSVLDGIRSTATAMNMGLIKINDCCTRLMAEFNSYSWDDKAVGEDRPIKESDHVCDLLRYFVYTNKLTVPRRQSLLD